MNDEIKEILDKIKNVANRETASRNALMEMKDTDYQLLLDYITNLQQIEQEHKKINGELREENSKLEIALQNIQEDYDRRVKENERLKEIINDDMTVYLEGLEDGKEKMKQCFESIYKYRCEKAVEYIKEHIRIDDEYPAYMEMLVEERDNLLNIFQNGSEKNE